MPPDAASQPRDAAPAGGVRGDADDAPRQGPWRVAVFVGGFPIRSETFVVRHAAGLIGLGHAVDIFADWRGDNGDACQPGTPEHELLGRTTFMNMPAESSPWELPAWPPWTRAWTPGAGRAQWNVARWWRATPHLARCLARAPRLTSRVLRRAEYGFQARSLSALYRLSRLSRCAGPYDVLHAHFGPVGNSFRFAREWFGAPLVVTFHGYDFSTVPRQQGPDFYHKLFAVADAVTANSRFAMEQVAALGCPAERLHHLPMGVDPDAFPFRPRRLEAGEGVRLLTVARLVAIKGHEVALEAVHRLRQRNVPVRYDVVGEGPERARLERRVVELGIEGCVQFHPACDAAGVREWFERSHLFVLPSRTLDGAAEAQGLVLQEAQASGMPVVGADSGGIAEGLLPGVSGLLFAQSDAVSLAEQIERLVRRPDSWEAMGRAGREFVSRQFNLRDLNRRWLDIYANAQRQYSAWLTAR